ncbi:oxygenase MpaB family protein [Streptomyces sp. NPDC047061]|uniref:oxygenase MpaB family protein n=1 Tax=Streptomyces sp. NPDC047061 TaxID=3154605 RepID=UPI0033DBDE87
MPPAAAPVLTCPAGDALAGGDPLADAVIAELDLHGDRVRHALAAGLRYGAAGPAGPAGPAGLDAPLPAAVAALLEQVETAPAGLDPLTPHRGDITTLSVPPLWFQLCSVPAALAHLYASPAVAGQLVRAGGQQDLATRRLVETGVWIRQALRPGGLLRGAPGYVATVRLRLRHARLRASATAGGRDTSAGGVPVSQADTARLWLGFTLVAYEALAAVGIEISGEEERHLYAYWSYVAHLLGIDDSLHQGVATHADARRLRDLLDSRTAAPDATSRALTAATVDAQARAMAGAPGTALSEEQVRTLIHRVLRQALGDGPAERLGLPAPTPAPTPTSAPAVAPATTDLMPLIGELNRQARYWQTFSASSAAEARRRALAEPGSAPEPVTGVLRGVTHCLPRRPAPPRGTRISAPAA